MHRVSRAGLRTDTTPRALAASVMTECPLFTYHWGLRIPYPFSMIYRKESDLVDTCVMGQYNAAQFHSPFLALEVR